MDRKLESFFGSDSTKSIGVDEGGTFTDLILINKETGEIFGNKILSAPLDPSLGTMHGVIEIYNLSFIRIQEIDQFHHGTTVAKNTTVEHQGAKAGLITTKGFRDIIQISRQKKTLTYPVQIEPNMERSSKKGGERKWASVGQLYGLSECDIQFLN